MIHGLSGFHPRRWQARTRRAVRCCDNEEAPALRSCKVFHRLIRSRLHIGSDIFPHRSDIVVILIGPCLIEFAQRRAQATDPPNHSTADVWIRGVFLVIMHYRFEDGKSTGLGSGQIAAIARVTTRRETTLCTGGNWHENRPRRHYC